MVLNIIHIKIIILIPIAFDHINGLIINQIVGINIKHTSRGKM